MSHKQKQKQQSHYHLNRYINSREQNLKSIHDKPVKKRGIEELYFNTIKTIYDNYMANIMLNVGKLKTLPLN